jgi:hypothetical protein
MFADAREKPTTAAITGIAAIALTGATATTYTAASGLGVFQAGAANGGHIVFGSAFANALNNGIHVLSAVAAGVLTTTGLAVETPPAAAMVQAVGYEFASATLDIVAVGNLPSLHRAGASTVDMTTLGLTPGEWIYVGGDVALNTFNNAPNHGWARIKSITVTDIFLDKTEAVGVANAVWTNETGTGKLIRIFFGTVLKNELAASIKRRTYQLERTIGPDSNGTMSEILVGSIPNELTVNVPQTDKATIDFSFVGLDVEQRTGLTGVKAGTRPTFLPTDAFNTSSDLERASISLVDATTSVVTPLWAFLSDLSLKITNNVTPNKALGVLGSFEATAGTFTVDGKITAYFADVPSVQAIRNNSDVTLDFILVKKNTAMVFDIPLVSLDDGKLAVEMDKPITLGVNAGGAESAFGHTLMITSFLYVPTASHA